MRIPAANLRFALIVVMVAMMLIFTRATGLTLIAMAIGTATAFMGIAYSYRQASAVGIMIISGAAAAAIEITSLTDVASLLTATFGLVIPVVVLLLVALSAETESRSRLRRGPIIRIVGFAAACMISVPLTASVISLVAPGVATRLPVLAEAAILLVVMIAALTALTWKEPTANKASAGE